MKGAAVLNIADKWPDLTTEVKYAPLPGKCAVKMCAPRKKHGSLHLPDTVAGKARPDAGVVIAVDAPRRLQNSEYDEQVPLEVGQRVYCRPYAGMFVEDGDDWVRIFNVEMDEEGTDHVPYHEHILAIDNPDAPFGLDPTGDNCIVERERKTSIIELLESYTDVGTVLAGPKRMIGKRVVIRHYGDLFTFAFGDEGRQLGLVPFSDLLMVIE